MALKEFAFEYTLNPLFHLSKDDPTLLIEFIKDSSNSQYPREIASKILAVISLEQEHLSLKINQALNETNNSFTAPSDLLDGPYEIVENKMTSLVEHFNNIPINYFKEDDDYFEGDMDSEKDTVPETMELEGGGVISKPNSLESAMFANYMMLNMELQKQQDAYRPSPSEGVAPLKPVLTPGKIGRNDPCPCGSGKKFKKCCLNNLN